MRKVAVFTLTLAILGTPLPGIASDTDSPPFLIYVDPVTGKYTKKRPEHASTTEPAQHTTSTPNIPRPNPQSTQIIPAFLIAGGLLLGGRLLTKMIIKK